MPTGSNATHTLTNKELEDTLREVIQRLIDGRQNFVKVGEYLKDDILKLYCEEESLKRAQFRAYLEAVLRFEGVHDMRETGIVSGAIHCTWSAIRAHLGRSDNALLQMAGAGEDEAQKAYMKALKKDLPLRQLLTAQYAHIQSSHDYVKAARGICR
jgi:uncharacterized protein (TIGR02284 family)